MQNSKLTLEQLLQHMLKQSNAGQSLNANQLKNVVTEMAKDLRLLQEGGSKGVNKFNELTNLNNLQNLKVLTEGYALAEKDPKFAYLKDGNMLGIMVATPDELKATPDLQKVMTKFKLDYVESQPDKKLAEEEVKEINSKPDVPVTETPGIKATPRPEIATKEKNKSDAEITNEQIYGKDGNRSEVEQVVVIDKAVEGHGANLGSVNDEARDLDKENENLAEKTAEDSDQLADTLAAALDKESDKEAAKLDEESDQLLDALADALDEESDEEAENQKAEDDEYVSEMTKKIRQGPRPGGSKKPT